MNAADLHFAALAAAESAVVQGQFNLAKVLRATAEYLRVAAMADARVASHGADASLREALQLTTSTSGAPAESVRSLIEKALGSLSEAPDVSETAVSQFVWICTVCGRAVEGLPPDSCVCGGLQPEFRGFFPFYAATTERLGRLTPALIRQGLASGHAVVEASIASISPDELKARPAPDEWSAGEIIAHMIETERLFQRRVSAILGGERSLEERPVMPWTLHGEKDYESMDGAELVAAHAAARGDTVAIMDGMDEKHWARSAQIAGERTTIADLGTWLVNHDTGHLAQLRRRR
jgi:uncharacterized damage-inducible protein DinB